MTAQLSVEIHVNTDFFGYETYWAFSDTGVACGVADHANGGNTVVGCAGCDLQVATAGDAGAYAGSSTIVAGPYMLPAGDYDLHSIDDFDDGTASYDIYVDGVLQHSGLNGQCAISTVTLVAIVDGCTDAAACNFDPAANNEDGSCYSIGDACDDADAGTTMDMWGDDGAGGCACAGLPVEIGCNDAAACNFNALSIADDGSCVYAAGCDTCSGETDGTGTVVDNLEVGDPCDDGSAFTINDTINASCNCVGEPLVDGCTDMAACNYDAAANNDDGSCCNDNCVTVDLFDSFGDGWDGATYTINDNTGAVVITSGGAFGGGSAYSDNLCLPDGCYTFTVNAGTCCAGEHTWAIASANEGAGVSGGDPAAAVFFYIGSPAPACVVFGCTDGGACNFDPLANSDDASCDYSCVGCTDVDGCNYDILFTIDDGSCDYSCYGCIDPLACNVDPLATIASNGTYGLDCCYDTCIDFVMTDSWGDGWNGNTYTLTDVGGTVVATGTIDTADETTIGGSGGGINGGTDHLCLADGCYFLTVDGGTFQGEVGWTFGAFSGGAPVVDMLVTVNAIAGCTDPLADNYDPLAACDNGTCSYCVAGQLTVIMTMGDSFGDGWNDATYAITDYTTDALVAFGALDFAQNGDGGSVGTDIFCLDPGCYNLTVGGGTFDGEISFSLDIDGGSNIYSSDAGDGAFGPQGFTIGTPGCVVEGCTDPICFNYNPYAGVDDGSCVCPPDNDLCDGAEAVMCGGIYTGSTALASDDILDTVCSETATGPGVWYTFDGTGDQVTASLCNSAYDTKVLVFEGACGALTCVGGNDDNCGLQSEFTWVSTAATDYYIYVTGFGTSTGDYELQISCTDCSGGTPGNDECVDASIQISGVPFSGSTCCANPEAADACTPAFATPYGVWFVMNSLDFDTFDFTLTNAGGSEIATTIFVDCGNLGCGNLTEIACGGPVTGTVAGDISAFATIIPNTDYYFYIYTTDAAGCGDFDFVATQAYVGCTDPLACNYDAAATVAADCIYTALTPVIAAGFAVSCPYEFVVDAGVDPCIDYDLIMNDSFGDGWNGAVYTVTDGVGTIIATGDLDTAAAGDGTTTGTDPLGCLASGSYFITVFGGTFDGEISWSIEGGIADACVVVAPANDECANAEALPCGSDLSGSNGSATSNAPAGALDCSAPGAGVWYTFTGDGSLHTISTCDSDIDTQVDIFVSDDGTCTGVMSCATDAVTGDFLTEVDDLDVTNGCGFFDQDDVYMSFVSVAATVYYVYVSYNGAVGGAFDISHTCEAYVPGCTNDTACNYDAAATYDDDSCEWASCVCDASCPGTGFGFQFAMADSFGDGWNGSVYTITNGTTGAVIATGDIDTALVGVDNDNFLGNELGWDYFCICDAGCYVIDVTDGDFPGEVSWDLNSADGSVTLISGTTGQFEFSVGGAVCGCTDPAACNFDGGATVENGTCEYLTCAGCMDAGACNFDPEATFDDGTYCCYDTCLTVVMIDGGFDGWEGGIWEIFSTAGALQASGTLADGGFGEATACLLDAGCYYLNVSGGSTFEYGWALIGADGYTGVASGDGAVTEFYFAVGGGECATCQTSVACNYDASGFFDDCTLCTFDCEGCTYLDATNYDAAAGIDDGSCMFDIANPCPTDINGDGSTGTDDLLVFLGAFGTNCPT